MNIEDFQIIKAVGSGKYAIVYEVAYKHDRNKCARYAMKRYFLSNALSVSRTLQERHILERLTSTTETSPFVPFFYCAVGGWQKPCIITTLGSAHTLYHLRCSLGVLTENDARFYVCELMCGLEFLHRMEIVHRDIKLENVLLSMAGHVIIADFDLAYDLRGHQNQLNSTQPIGTYEYMAPEIANGGSVTTKADVWSLGALTTYLVTASFRPIVSNNSQRAQMAKSGSYEKENIAPLSAAMRNFLHACLHPDYLKRPEISELASKQYFRSVSWMEVAACCSRPPFQLSQVRYSNLNSLIIDPTHEVVRKSAFGQNKPIIEGSRKLSDISRLDVVPVDLIELELNGYTADTIENNFESFNFVNPLLVESDLENENS